MRKWLVYSGIGLGGLIVGAGIGASGKNTTKTVTSALESTVTQNAPPAKTVRDTVTVTQVRTVVRQVKVKVPVKPAGPAGSFPGNGTFLVGKDMRPGTYRAAPSDGCYWARLKDLSGSLDAIIANDNAKGQVVVTIAPSDKAFTDSNCSTFQRIG